MQRISNRHSINFHSTVIDPIPTPIQISFRKGLRFTDRRTDFILKRHSSVAPLWPILIRHSCRPTHQRSDGFSLTSPTTPSGYSESRPSVRVVFLRHPGGERVFQKRLKLKKGEREKILIRHSFSGDPSHKSFSLLSFPVRTPALDGCSCAGRFEGGSRFPSAEVGFQVKSKPRPGVSASRRRHRCRRRRCGEPVRVPRLPRTGRSSGRRWGRRFR
jgi:hypothetical protein